MSARTADVCLICEGCYPFVTGGVSEWVQTLVRGLPDLKFSVLAMVAGEGPRQPRYPRPDNLVGLYVLDIAGADLHAPDPGAGPPWARTRGFLRGLVSGLPRDFEAFVRAVRGLDPQGLSPAALLEDAPEAFRILCDMAEERQPTAPLLESLYSLRSMLLPLLRVLQAPLPPARIYHPVSSGYAGLAGAVAKVVTGRPVVLTEHGLYTKEAELDVRRASWLADRQKPTWVAFFRALGRLGYQHADQVFALFERNRQLQVQLGAPRLRTRVIPNGVDLSAYGARPRQDDGRPPSVGIVARLAPIKDVKTFLRAARLVADAMPEARFHVLGPDDEARTYADECRLLARDLELEGVVRFEGRVDPREWYPRLDVVALSSVKEAQPLTLLEGMAAGCLPVGTAVGAVPEMLRGVGDVVPQRRPGAMAAAILRALRLDPPAREARRELARRRAAEYSLARFLAAYREVYAGAMAPESSGPAPRPGAAGAAGVGDLEARAEGAA